jgi:hypothetical protein
MADAGLGKKLRTASKVERRKQLLKKLKSWRAERWRRGIAVVG